MLDGAGLTLERSYGGYDGSLLSVETRRMILAAEEDLISVHNDG